MTFSQFILQVRNIVDVIMPLFCIFVMQCPIISLWRIFW